jgi:hypothetical protein
MPQVTIDIAEDTIALLTDLARACTRAARAREGATTHGPLTVPALIAMLAEDAAMTISRPGSWEGANMANVLSSHGYL